MNHCKTCKYWITPDEDGNEKQLTEYIDPITFEPIRPPFEVRVCKHPAQRFCERPLGKDGFAVADGSTYFACLATAEEFGCVRHEAL
jgi:hypothetical protein